MAALQLSWYKFKSHYTDFISVLLGILIFEGLILYIQEEGFLKTFEATRMTLFLLLFSSSLLILVQTSIYISKERSILNRDFFSTLSRRDFAQATLMVNSLLALCETLVFCVGFHVLTNYFDKELVKKGQLFGQYWFELGITVFLVFLCAHFFALLISALAGSSEIASVILAVVTGIAQFSLSGTILQLPDAIKSISNYIFLSHGHKLIAMTNELETLKSAMADFGVPIPEEQLEQFAASHSAILEGWLSLVCHAVIYAGLFTLVLVFKKK